MSKETRKLYSILSQDINDWTNPCATETVTLDVLNSVLVCSIQDILEKNGCSNNIKCNVYFDNRLRQMFLSLIHYIAGETLEKVEHNYPKDWWEAFKERWFPKWLIRHYPIQRTYVTMDAKAVYPKVTFKNNAHTIHLNKEVYDARD